MDPNELLELLRKVNKAGYKGERLIGLHEIPITASQDIKDRWVPIYDDGPETASEIW